MKLRVLTKRRSILLLLLLGMNFLLQCNIYSQNRIIKGIIVDSVTQKALGNAHIFIKETSIGTISNSSGLFRLVIPEKFNNNTICIQFLGYITYEFSAQTKKNEFFTIMLAPASFSLNQIEINPLDPKKIILRSIDSIKAKIQNNPYISQVYYKEKYTNNKNIVQQYEIVFDAYIKEKKKKRKTNINFLKGRHFIDTNKIEFYAGNSCLSILSYNPVLDFYTSMSVFNKRNFKKYDFLISDISKFEGEDVIVISYKPKKKYENEAISGRIFIEKKSYFPIRFERDFSEKNKLTKIKTYKYCSFVETSISFSIHSYYLYKNSYYLGYISFFNQFQKQCSEEDSIETIEHKIDLITTSIQTENVVEIPKEQRVKKGRLDRLIMEECDSDYWGDYNVIEYEHSNLDKINSDTLIYPTN